MAEKFRRIKKKDIGLVGKINQSYFWLGGLVLLFLAAAGGRAIFFWNKNASGLSQINSEIKDKNLAVVLCRDENCFWLNKEGVSFNRGGFMKGNLVLSLKDKTGRRLGTGQELLKPETIAELYFLKSKIQEELKISLKEGETKDSALADFDFVTGEGWKLKLNVNENAYKTLETLKQSLAEIQKTAPTVLLEYIDLRIPNKVYYKFR